MTTDIKDLSQAKRLVTQLQGRIEQLEGQLGADTYAWQSDEPTEDESLIACLGDDAAKLMQANPDDEMATTMLAAAVRIAVLQSGISSLDGRQNEQEPIIDGYPLWSGLPPPKSQPVAQEPVTTMAYRCNGCDALYEEPNISCDCMTFGSKPMQYTEYVVMPKNAAVMAKDFTDAPVLSDAQIDAAIDAYDATWNPGNRGYENKFDAMKAALTAAIANGAAK